MKKSFVIVLAFAVLLSFFAFANAVNTSNFTGNLPMDLEEAGRKVSEEGRTVLSGEVKIPDALHGLAKLFLGFEKNPRLDVFIILIMIWIVLFILLYQLLYLVPFFESNIIRVVATLVIMLLMGISGGLKAGAEFFIDIGNLLAFLDRWPVIKFLIVIAVVFAIFLGSSRLLRLLRQSMEIEIAEKVGRRIAEGSKSAELFNKARRKLAGR